MARITWNAAKRRRILAERGFDLLRAVLIFRRPTIVSEDRRHDYGEARYVALGSYEGEYFYVVYTRRQDPATGEDIVHVITAWRAGRRGRRRYRERYPR